ncbi:MAG: von Willebrand factor type A domain-containing protein [Alphaproteobacteria bacterium]|nr:von Willebrand factor type A domain-containing protein [Alphaproteobacteria bacterium]
MRSTLIPMLVLAACGTASDKDSWSAADSDVGDYDGDGTSRYEDTATPDGTDTAADDEGEPRDDTGVPGETVPTNPWVDTTQDALSTFSVDVDSASYSLARREIGRGVLPAPSTVRTEEFVNYFRYEDAGPQGDEPFTVHLELAPAPFGPAPDVELLRIHLQSKTVPPDQRKPANLVFLIDVSGSMNAPDKLGLVKWSLSQLIDKLGPADTLGIVVYAGAERVVLEPTEAAHKSTILDAIDALQAGGSTNGEAGIRRAYQLAKQAFVTGGINRVVLATDGDFNVGLTGESLIREVESWRDQGIFLTTLGFGMRNTQEAFLEQLADRGDGNHAFVDSRNEALRVLGDRLVSTLQVVAKDVKIQVAFDPAAVERWRLIGYENRVLAHEDFADDTKDAGEIGAGHGVTAFYEVDLAPGAAGPLAEVHLRHKPPEGGASTEQTWSLDVEDGHGTLAQASPSFRFGAAVAEWAEILRRSPHSEGAPFAEVHALASEAWPPAARGPEKTEFLGLVNASSTLWRP